MRALIVVAGLRMSRTPPDIEVLTLESGVGVRLYRPAGSNEPAPALLWIHAGGYVMGTAQQDDRLCLRFSSRLGITVASVDYRLAPENPYPAVLDWESCDHTAPVHEGDTLYSELHIESAQAHADGGVLGLRSLVYAVSDSASEPDRQVLDWRFSALQF